MRRLSLALLLLPLALACASQPKKLKGSYAVVVDPSLSPAYAEALTTALDQRLDISATPAAADALIVLRRGTTDADIAYEILRDSRLVVSKEPTSTVQVRGSQRSIQETLEWERRQDDARFGTSTSNLRSQDSFRPATAFNPDIAAKSRERGKVRRVADMIAYDLRTLP
jgi:hypothetical protein